MRVTNSYGRSFDLVGTEPYTRKDGKETTLRVWMSECAVCSEAFIVKTPAHAECAEDSGSFYRKHCINHKMTKEEVSKKWSDSMRKRTSEA